MGHFIFTLLHLIAILFTGFILLFLTIPLHIVYASIRKSKSKIPTEGINRQEMNCPFCAEVILARAIVCKHCGRDLPSASEYSSSNISQMTNNSDPIPTAAKAVPKEIEKSITVRTKILILCSIAGLLWVFLSADIAENDNPNLDESTVTNIIPRSDEQPSATFSDKTTSTKTKSKIDVAEVQKLLSTLGFELGVSDGILGNRTKGAVEQFQSANEMSVTGEITDALIRSLREKSKASNNTVRSDQPSRETLIPRSMTENADYHLISVDPDGSFIKTLHRRTSSWGTGYSVTRINCRNMSYMDLGYGEDSQSNIEMYDDTGWTEAVLGSSKSDLVNFVCK